MFKKRSLGRPASRRRLGLLSAGVLATLTTVWGLAYVTAAKPPVDAFAAARQALGQARQAEAPRYAPAWFEDAADRWSEALGAWQHENTRWFMLRDYAAARQAAVLAARQGRAAALRARTVSDSLRWVATAGLPLLRDQIDLLLGEGYPWPFRAGWRAAVAEAHNHLAAGEGALARQDYWTAAEKTRLAADCIRRLGGDLSGAVQAYLEDLPLWQRWQAEAQAWSARRGAPAIVVDKMAHRLYVYAAGRLQHTYTVDLGPSWLGPKRHEGDLSTPEGRYRIVRKREAGETVYYRALEIDYPNEEDRHRFREARRQGTLPADARIGGLIEIHGEGGRGVNWTLGCIALPNTAMKALYDAIPVGTPVTIVGALEAPAFASELLAAFDPVPPTPSLPTPRKDDAVR